MAVRVRYSLELIISSSSAEEKDLANSRYEVVTDAHTMGGSWKTLLAAAATDVELKLDNLTETKLLAIRTNSSDINQSPVSIDIKRNGVGNEPIRITPLSSTKEGHFLISTEGLTSLHATNNGTVAMEVTVFVVGD